LTYQDFFSAQGSKEGPIGELIDYWLALITAMLTAIRDANHI